MIYAQALPSTSSLWTYVFCLDKPDRVQMKSNCLAWNPMEAYNFTIANEDHNLYTFDTRKMAMARNVHMDHVSAVYALPYLLF